MTDAEADVFVAATRAKAGTGAIPVAVSSGAAMPGYFDWPLSLFDDGLDCGPEFFEPSFGFGGAEHYIFYL